MVVNNGEHIGVGSMSQFLGIPKKIAGLFWVCLKITIDQPPLVFLLKNTKSSQKNTGIDAR